MTRVGEFCGCHFLLGQTFPIPRSTQWDWYIYRSMNGSFFMGFHVGMVHVPVNVRR